jgi:hypothetical protein
MTGKRVGADDATRMAMNADFQRPGRICREEAE